MFSPYRDHFNKALMTHDATSSKDVMNPGNLFVMTMVRTTLHCTPKSKIEEIFEIYIWNILMIIIVKMVSQ